MGDEVQGCTTDWMTVTEDQIEAVKNAAVNASEDNSNPLWVIHARYEGDLIPGQLDVNSFVATVPYDGKAQVVTDFQVAIRDSSTLRWVNGYDGFVPNNAVIGGKIKCSGEKLFVGRGEYEGKMIPGKIQVSDKVLYICYDGSEVPLDQYQVLCVRGGC